MKEVTGRSLKGYERSFTKQNLSRRKNLQNEGWIAEFFQTCEVRDLWD